MSETDGVAAIKQTKYRYLRALDTRDWDLFAAQMTEDVVAEYGASVGAAHQFTDRDALVEFMRTSMTADVISEHRVAHPEITLDGPDSATGTWYLQDKIIVPKYDFMLTGAAFYTDRYRRTDGRWQISVTGYRRTYEATMKMSAMNLTVQPGEALQI